MLTSYSTRIQSVSEITRSIRGLLETEFPFVTVAGEISNLRQPHSGHLYFTLKDAEAQIKAVMFKPQQRYLGRSPENGMQIICRGRISVYEQRGEYQIIIDTIDSKGTGALQIAFERLKNMLAEQGLFDQQLKRKLPFLPELVTLITSPDGAALQDFTKVARTRFPGLSLEVFPVRVQGEGAAKQIAEAIFEINKRGKSDIIVLCRGGGSIEDLWAFNEEQVARAIFASTIPIVSAIGHEIDFTISDFVADYRAATPTAAAEAVIPDQKALKQKVSILENRLASIFTNQINQLQGIILDHRRILGDPTTALSHFSRELVHARTIMTHALAGQLREKTSGLEKQKGNLLKFSPENRLKVQNQYIKEIYKKLCLMAHLQIERKKAALQKAASLLDAVSPLAVLGRGYSITRSQEGEVVRSTDQVTLEEKLEILLHNGSLSCRVTDIKKPYTTNTPQGFCSIPP
ncbi:MAG: exodeoxyribonuclease VII large subunit [Proteobacteria bacterium]|nr:exodeoxyribonuclease VII large subunit [Pseudomonadota bacterium]MBU1715203.1 exodeoxyribonuclease VII large subunit [Pseudomonadota bacterium]